MASLLLKPLGLGGALATLDTEDSVNRHHPQNLPQVDPTFLSSLLRQLSSGWLASHADITPHDLPALRRVTEPP